MAGSKLIKDGNKELFRNAQKNVEEWESIVKMQDMFKSEMERNWKEEEKVIWFSNGNGKADVPSYSTMPGFSCMWNGQYPPCFTSGKCYALYDIRNNVPLERCVHNTVLIIKFPEYFERSFDMMCKLYPSIRLHVDGDFCNLNELSIVDRVRKNNPNTLIMTYTKKYDMCNKYMEDNGIINGNFVLLYSKWDGLYMNNKFNMPECHVYSTCEEYIESNDKQRCGFIGINPDGTYNFIKGQCSQCFIHYLMKDGKGGCWDVKENESVAMLAH